jgi:hypothetical protein
MAEVPVCFASGEPRHDLGHFCDVCIFANACASMSKSFVKKEDIQKSLDKFDILLDKARKINRGEKE